MSFSLSVKDEILSSKKKQKACCEKAMLFGILLFAARCDENIVQVATENERLAKKISRILKYAFNILKEPEIRRNTPSDMPLYMITLEKSDELSLLFHAFPEGLSDRETFHGIICANYEKCCMDAILQGAFLCGGYVTNPEKNYHLEFVSPNENIANIFSEFLREVYGFSPRTIKRKQNTIVYFKESENIEDMLSTMGAISSALSIMEIKVVKDVRNTVNRQVNCETANLTKTVDAFEKHKAAIEKISRTAGLESLSLPLREVANLRLSYPELSLKELGELANPKISKSGMNHRLKKLIEISESL